MRKKNSSKHQYLTCQNNCRNRSIRYDTLAKIVLNEINKRNNKFNFLNRDVLTRFINKIYIDCQNKKNRDIYIEWNLY